MPSPGTLKSLSKALNTHIPTLTVPLPDDLTEVLESYLEKHEKYDDSSSERLQEELLSVHEKHVAGHPERLAPFIAVLSQLFPAIRSSSRISLWWDLLKDEFDNNFLNEKDLVPESFSALSSLLSLDDVQPEEGRDPAVHPFVARSISMWMEQYQGTSVGKPVDHIEKGFRETLISYGKRKPKDFLTTLDTFFVRADCRMKSATLLCDFIQAQPPHLYVALETPLFNNLLRCLQLDTSTTVVSLTLTALTMLLPHSPASLVPRLPTLFNIYARLLFWHRQLPEPADVTSEQSHPKPLIDPAGWEACSYSPDLDANSISSLRIYFTILYGLYPINLMDYIRKPYRYLRHANDPSVDVVEVQPSEIRHKSEEFQRCHLLHPNFYHLTIESEKTDHGRWQASEPAEVVADCTALCIAEDQHELERADDDDVCQRSSLFSRDEANSGIPDFALLRAVSTNDGVKSGQLSRRGSADTRPRSAAGPGDSPTLPSQLTVSPSQTQLQDLINSNKAIKSGLSQSLANDSAPSLSLSQQELNAETTGGSAQPATRSRATSSLSTADTGSLVSQLRRQVLLLQNDLSFERYLKQQHMAHMGELRRRQVKEAASEAEMQNLIIANRNLKSRFEDAKNTEMQVKKESEKSRSLAKKWEADLSAKLKVMREDNKKIKAQVAELEHEVGRSSAECEELKAQLCACEVRELQWNQNIQAYEVDMSEMDRLKSEVARLAVTERDYQARKAEMERADAAVEEAESEVRVLTAKLEAQDQDLQRTIQAYELQLATLKSRVTEQGHAASSERPSSSSTHHAIEAALSAGRAKQAELQKQYDLLSRKYTALQSSLFDMQCDLSAAAGPPSKPSPAARHDGDDARGQASSLSSSPTQPRARIQRMFSSSDAFEAATGYNARPTLGARSSTSTAGPSEAGTSSSAAAPGTDHRSQGRGVLGGKFRKEGKDKEGDKDKDKDKKDRKLGGLRGMRNFHVV